MISFQIAYFQYQLKKAFTQEPKTLMVIGFYVALKVSILIAVLHYCK